MPQAMHIGRKHIYHTRTTMCRMPLSPHHLPQSALPSRYHIEQAGDCLSRPTWLTDLLPLLLSCLLTVMPGAVRRVPCSTAPKASLTGRQGGAAVGGHR